jgi:hypothetical protein
MTFVCQLLTLCCPRTFRLTPSSAETQLALFEDYILHRNRRSIHNICLRLRLALFTGDESHLYTLAYNKGLSTVYHISTLRTGIERAGFSYLGGYGA